MAGALNRVQLIGHLGHDPESRAFGKGGKVVSLSLATSESWTDPATGRRQRRTQWHDVSILNQGLATLAETCLRAGSLCYVEGQLETRKWPDGPGGERQVTEIVVRPNNGALLVLDGAARAADPRSPDEE